MQHTQMKFRFYKITMIWIHESLIWKESILISIILEEAQSFLMSLNLQDWDKGRASKVIHFIWSFV